MIHDKNNFVDYGLYGFFLVGESSSLYEVHSARRRSLSKWLSNVCMDEINAEVQEKKLQVRQSN